LVGAIEAAEDREAAELELGVDEAGLVLAAGDDLVEERPDLVVDALEDLVVVRGQLGGELDARGGVGEAALLDAHLDQLADVVQDEDLLGQVEVAVDVAERLQVDDDGAHLLLGALAVLREAQAHVRTAGERVQTGATPCADSIARRRAIGTWHQGTPGPGVPVRRMASSSSM